MFIVKNTGGRFRVLQIIFSIYRTIVIGYRMQVLKITGEIILIPAYNMGTDNKPERLHKGIR